MLAMADRKGRIEASIPGLANRARVTLEECEHALERFMAPDKYSRTPDNDGRRIEPMDGGWRLLNYEKYREMRHEEARRDYMRDYMQDYRKQEKFTVNPSKPPLAQAEAEAEAEKEEKHVNGSRKALATPPDESPVIQTLPLREGRDFPVRQSLVAELEPLYPAVDVAATLNEMKGWLIGNPDRRKTQRGIRRFITSWLQSEQEKYGAAQASR